jgi:outer membrane protein TolC
LPWFNEKKYGAAVREVLDQVTTTQHTLDGAKTGALGRLEDQLQKIQTLRHQTDLYEKSLIADAKQNVSANRADYKAGSSNIYEAKAFQQYLFSVRSSAQRATET